MGGLRRSRVGWFVVASLGSAVLGAFFLRLVGAGFDADARGAFRAILAALAGFGFFATGLQVSYALLLAPSNGGAAAPARLRWVAVVVAVGAAGIALLGGLVWLPEGAESPVVAVVISGYVLVSGYAALPKARLLIERRWNPLAAAISVGALAKFMVALAARDADTIAPALVGLLIAELVAAAVAELLARRITPGIDGDSELRLRPFMVALVSLGGLWVLGSLDSVVARQLMPAADADVYAATASLARLVLFAPSVVTWIALPGFFDGTYGSRGLRRTLWASLGAAAVVAICPAIVVATFPTELLRLWTGEPDAVSVPATGLLALAAVLLALSTLLVFFHVARRSRLAFAPWVGALVVSIGAPIVGRRPVALAAVVLAAVLATCAVLLLPALTRVRPVTAAIQAHSSPRAGSLPIRDIVVVVPCYNPGPAVVSTLERIAAALAPVAESFEVIAVSDGSTDGTPDLIDALGHGWLRHIRCETNGGKGRALRYGFEAAHAGTIGFIDADGDLPPEQLPAYLQSMEEYQADAVLGSKRHPDSHLAVPAVRRLYSWGFQRLVRLLFQLDIRDTQTGVKLFRRALIDDVLPMLQEDGFALDLEILVAAQAHGYRRIVELPVRLEHQFNSTISSRSAARMLVSTVGIFWRSRMSLRYLRLASGPSTDR